MTQNIRSFRNHYPLHAVAAVSAAGLLMAFNVVVGFLFMALVPPLIPVYICVLFGGVCLVQEALRYAQRVSIQRPATMLRSGKHEEELAKRALAARTA
jgi:hypothetical protein